MKLKNLLFVLSLVTFFSCKKIDKTLLYGKWKGASLLEKGKPKDANLAEFNFYPNGIYTYQNSYYKEAGNFRTLEDKLYTTDTTQDNRKEKVVRVSQLTMDSLYIEMNKGGIPQLLKCYKAK